MFFRLALAALFMLPAPVQPAPDGLGQVILDNRTSLGADLFVDGEWQCYAPAHSGCLAEVPSGIHAARIVFDDGDYIVSDPFEVPEDRSVTLPVRDLTA